MCGDVNLYINDPDNMHSAEIEVRPFPRIPATHADICLSPGIFED